MAQGMVAGKVAIVTGGGRGIGRAIALLLAQEGARVLVCDVGASLQGAGTDAEPAQEVVDEIRQRGGEAIASTLSIAEPPNADTIVKTALGAFGRIDILVNNAGILRDVIFHKMSWSDWSDVIGVHLHGSFNMSRACAAHFREQGSGAFVHMTSTSGLVGNFGQANYMAAKLGIMGLSRGIALDMRRFNHLLAGASWMDEYGDPDKPEEWAYISKYSPYQNVAKDKSYSRVLFTTSTRDDRVHPGHARKMVAKMKEQGHDVLYYENIEGGHGGAANNKQAAFMSAVAYTFLLKELWQP